VAQQLNMVVVEEVQISPEQPLTPQQVDMEMVAMALLLHLVQEQPVQQVHKAL
jgi:hypothetical protein